MNKFAIYTAVVGNYDEISQPLVVDPRFDYFLFSNTISEKQIGVWQVKPIEYTNSDQVKIARYVKTHPEILLPDYAATLWMDANIQIADVWIYERIVDLFKNNYYISSVNNSTRDCAYEELVAVCSLGFESLEVGKKWFEFIRDYSYPRHIGLHETGILFRRNNDDNQHFDDKWWRYIEMFSCRDQLSFDFVLWQLQRNCSPFFHTGETVWTSSFVKLIKHPAHDYKVKLNSQYYCLLRLWDYYNMNNSICSKNFYQTWLDILSFPLPIARALFKLWRQSVRIHLDICNYLKTNGESC